MNDYQAVQIAMFLHLSPGGENNEHRSLGKCSYRWRGQVRSGRSRCAIQARRKIECDPNTLKLQPFKAICDTTDQRINMGSEELPAGIRTTTELMAIRGSWISADNAIPFLEALRDHITSNNVRFGLLSNQQAEVLAELDEVLGFVKAELPRAEKFNFSVVM